MAKNCNEEKHNEENRNKVIVKTSVVGIVTNVILASVKAVIGLMANSIAVVLDAVNNLSDALSSIITIVGNKLSRKLPNEKHPLGYGRIEYLTAMVIASIVIYAGITSCVESIKKIIHPEEADYSTVSLIIIAIAVVVKVILGRYVKSQGERVNSGSLIASGSDALFDAILSLSVLASALIFIFTGLSLEAYVGVLISIFIVKAGFEMLKDTVSDLLGKKNDNELTKQIKSLIRSEEGIHGAYDLVINDYGPEKKLASVHVELPDTMTVADLDSWIPSRANSKRRSIAKQASSSPPSAFTLTTPKTTKPPKFATQFQIKSNLTIGLSRCTVFTWTSKPKKCALTWSLNSA